MIINTVVSAYQAAAPLVKQIAADPAVIFVFNILKLFLSVDSLVIC